MTHLSEDSDLIGKGGEGANGALLALAERVEALTGPSREVDAEIFRLTQRPYATCHRTERCNPCEYNCRRKGLRNVEPTTNGGRSVFWLWFKDGCSGGTDDVPYTASLDAALTLVPEGWAWQTGQVPRFRATADLHVPGKAPGVRVVAATPALALCATALRARAAA